MLVQKMNLFTISYRVLIDMMIRLCLCRKYIFLGFNYSESIIDTKEKKNETISKSQEDKRKKEPKRGQLKWCGYIYLLQKITFIRIQKSIKRIYENKLQEFDILFIMMLFN